MYNYIAHKHTTIVINCSYCIEQSYIYFFICVEKLLQRHNPPEMRLFEQVLFFFFFNIEDTRESILIDIRRKPVISAIII